MTIKMLNIYSLFDEIRYFAAGSGPIARHRESGEHRRSTRRAAQAGRLSARGRPRSWLSPSIDDAYGVLAKVALVLM